MIRIRSVLSPDSWQLEGYRAGRLQLSLDKMYLRDWPVQSGLKKVLESGPEGKEG